ncbi:helix-turn-helix domain-containing protein [Vibrio sp. qd031]|uniref:helix-turn-helix domain-containing protein n=1 Tax=Vibrio sp. qd031 TaxID=1603038 RepID=UPI000A10E656|nr:helix-turn-helix domain-containing protein [Vibrio sp. qd031]
MLITMSDRDINRFKVLQDVRERRLRQIDAAAILNISPRQVRRLLSQLNQFGASSLAHSSRGRPSNRRYPDEFRSEVLTIIRAQYADFSPTFACEKLTEQHTLHFSVETLRQWMIDKAAN